MARLLGVALATWEFEATQVLQGFYLLLVNQEGLASSPEQKETD